MIINLLCDNPNSWIVPTLKEIERELSGKGHEVRRIDSCLELKAADITFLLSCERIVPAEYLNLSRHNLVVHESDLPEGKGWSPLTWQVLEGKDRIPVTLFEAVPELDAGPIYFQEMIELDGTELLPEMKEKQGLATRKLVNRFVDEYPIVNGVAQVGAGSYYPRRTKKDSELDIHKSIDEQFDLLRVVDNDRYPAFFYRQGVKYIIKICKE